MAQYEITSEEAPLDFECTMNDMTERTIRNAKNLLTLRKGEIPFDRNRGLDGEVLDMPMKKAQEIITQELDRVMMWEPDAEVVTGWIERDKNGESIVHCVIEITFE